jgi:hypothetical protein
VIRRQTDERHHTCTKEELAQKEYDAGYKYQLDEEMLQPVVAGWPV